MPERTVYKYHTQGYTLSATTGGASANVIYTCPPNYNGTVRYLHISNSDNSTQNCSVQFYHQEENVYHYIMRDTGLAGKSILNLVNGGYFFMHAGDKIVAYSAGSPSAFDILVSVEEEPAQYTFTGA
jgi:hypothetical protein